VPEEQQQQLQQQQLQQQQADEQQQQQQLEAQPALGFDRLICHRRHCLELLWSEGEKVHGSHLSDSDLECGAWCTWTS
jgi:hypothetical protein